MPTDIGAALLSRCGDPVREPATFEEAVSAIKLRATPGDDATSTEAEMWRPLEPGLFEHSSDPVKACRWTPAGLVNPSRRRAFISCCAAPSAPLVLRLRSSDCAPLVPRMEPLILRHSACGHEHQMKA